MSADDIARNLAQVSDRIREQIADGLEDLVEHIGKESQRLCPVDDGTLVESMKTKVDRTSLTAAIGYGSGAAADHAVAQHERTGQSHDAGRQAKFLEQPFQKIGHDKGLEIIARRVR